MPECASCGQEISYDGTYWYHVARALEKGSDACILHDHREYVEGCFRCDLSRDEINQEKV